MCIVHDAPLVSYSLSSARYLPPPRAYPALPAPRQPAQHLLGAPKIAGLLPSGQPSPSAAVGKRARGEGYIHDLLPGHELIFESRPTHAADLPRFRTRQEMDAEIAALYPNAARLFSRL